VLAAATSLFREVFVPVTRSRTKGRTHPAASVAGGTGNISITRYQKSTNTQPTSILSNAQGAKYQPQYACVCHSIRGVMCPQHAEIVRWKRHFLDGYENLCERCRPYAPDGSNSYTGADALKYCAFCEKRNIWCEYCLNQEEREKCGGSSHADCDGRI
jgi:hypothetical protein